MIYMDYEIEKFGKGYTVCYCGDEVFFTTVEEAKKFIEEVQ